MFFTILVSKVRIRRNRYRPSTIKWSSLVMANVSFWNADPPILLFRLPSNEINFTSQHQWKVKSFGSRSSTYRKVQSQMAPTQRGIGLSVLTTFSFKCAPGFHGPLCDSTCGHESGQLDSTECEAVETRCPPGYMGHHCDIRKYRAFKTVFLTGSEKYNCLISC